MPNRILKESICASETVDALTSDEERLFTRLITKCDDYGCFDARPAILRAECFPLKVDQISLDQVGAWLARLAEVGLIRLYSVDGRAYLQMVTWRKHQQQRANKPKWPLPTAFIKEDVQASASNGLQTPADSLVSGNVFENVFVNENDGAKIAKPALTREAREIQIASHDAPPHGGIPNASLFEKYAARLKTEHSNRAGILGEAFIELFARPPNHGRLGKLGKDFGSGETLWALFKALPEWRGMDDPLNLAQKILSNKGNGKTNGHAGSQYVDPDTDVDYQAAKAAELAAIEAERVRKLAAQKRGVLQ